MILFKLVYIFIYYKILTIKFIVMYHIECELYYIYCLYLYNFNKVQSFTSSFSYHHFRTHTDYLYLILYNFSELPLINNFNITLLQT